MTTRHMTLSPVPLLLSAMLWAATEIALGQGQTNWLAVGSMQNFYADKGCEWEEMRGIEQQDGLRWPAQYNYQDMQAAKGFWIGVKNFIDQTGVVWSERVAHVGPRINGNGEFYPVQFTLKPKFDPPSVVVDGQPSSANLESVSDVDTTIKPDRVLVNVVNTSVGVTMTRKIYAFSQQYHDNYHIFDFTFTNTGYIDGTNVKVLSQTLSGVYFYWQYRYAICREMGNIVNNSARWGMNTMNDARGYPPDAAHPPIGANDVKAQFTWHGYHSAANLPTAGSSPNASTFSNIGGPIWLTSPIFTLGLIPLSDSTGRLGAAQFVGTAFLAADAASDGSSQPSTTNYIASDDPILTSINPSGSTRQTYEYNYMSTGHLPRQAWVVDPTGNFSNQTAMGNIKMSVPVLGSMDGSPGGWENATGYGPYTLAPGQSVHIAFVEAASGLTHDECIRIGRAYKVGSITTPQKNDSVLITGRTRLFDTFRRAIANYNSGYNIPQPPFPPGTFAVQSSADKINLSWTPNPKESAKGFVGYRIYRALARRDSNYSKIFECGPGTANPIVVYSYSDANVTRGPDYYYYITSFGAASANTGVGLTPPGSLESSRFYTQTYFPANLKRKPGTSPDSIRIAPNPYNISANANNLLFPNTPDKIAFFNIPGNCLISIYTELGEKIKEIDHADGTGDAYWNSVTSSNQVIASGVYLVVFQNRDTGQRTIKKLVVIR